MKLAGLLTEPLVLLDLKSESRDDALREMVAALKRSRAISKEKALYEKMLQREKLGSTAVGGGVAIPHGKHKDIKKPIVLVALSRKGVEFGAPDGNPIRVFFFVVSHPDNPGLNLQILAAIAHLLRKAPALAERLAGAGTAGRVLEIIRQQEESLHEC
ncbi:MAG: PTS sugar transporter subunit IIA [Candidatus Aminicenantes bacterium]|nr:PTS sugar transporter subunit IIA [Candidatus Aminicenantes bacterium]